MSMPTHTEYPGQVQKAEARGIGPTRAREIVDEAARQARKQVYAGEYMGQRTIVTVDLNTGRPLPLDEPSELCNFEVHLEEVRQIRLGELVDRAIADELAGNSS
jgi:hypothetical protein